MVWRRRRQVSSDSFNPRDDSHINNGRGLDSRLPLNDLREQRARRRRVRCSERSCPLVVSGTFKRQMVPQKVPLNNWAAEGRPLTRRRTANMIAFVMSRTFKWSFIRAKMWVITRVQMLRAGRVNKASPARDHSHAHSLQ